MAIKGLACDPTDTNLGECPTEKTGSFPADDCNSQLAVACADSSGWFLMKLVMTALWKAVEKLTILWFNVDSNTVVCEIASGVLIPGFPPLLPFRC